MCVGTCAQPIPSEALVAILPCQSHNLLWFLVLPWDSLCSCTCWGQVQMCHGSYCQTQCKQLPG